MYFAILRHHLPDYLLNEETTSGGSEPSLQNSEMKVMMIIGIQCHATKLKECLYSDCLDQ